MSSYQCNYHWHCDIYHDTKLILRDWLFHLSLESLDKVDVYLHAEVGNIDLTIKEAVVVEVVVVVVVIVVVVEVVVVEVVIVVEVVAVVV